MPTAKHRFVECTHGNAPKCCECGELKSSSSHSEKIVEVRIDTHADGWKGDGRTLCGIAIEGECSRGEGGDPAPIICKESDRITCEDCIEIIRYCRSAFTDRLRR